MYRNMALFSTYLGRALTERAYKRWELEVVSSILTPPQSGDGLMAELYWLLGTSVREKAARAFIASLFLSVRWDSVIDRGGESFSFTRENTNVGTENHQGEHVQAPVLATWHIRLRKVPRKTKDGRPNPSLFERMCQVACTTIFNGSTKVSTRCHHNDYKKKYTPPAKERKRARKDDLLW